MTFKSILLASALAACAPFPLSSAFAQTAESAAVAKSQSQATQRPNVLVWMLDDVGFAQIGSYGGLVETPNIDRVARLGLRYTNYHTTPICSASRAAFLTGRNSHSVRVGGHSAGARPYPGYDSEIPAEDGTIAAYLKRDGYATFALGKWDHLPSAQQSGPGPFRLWPSGQGFDRFYGFLAADTSNWEPTLVSDNTSIPTPRSPSYHLSTDMADKAIEMIAVRRATAKPAPFFMYWATGAAHAPHHAPPEWIERFRGQFDDGWDSARQRILDRQIAQGLVPKATKLPPRPDGMPAWKSLSREQKRLYARQMEVFAASLSHADHEFGRILGALEASGELNDTIVVITSDNGASAEGAVDGSFNEMLFVNGVFPDVSANLKHYETWGDPST
ncbi:MAG: sulfatase-like hydrolase/transferase, partial [Caulobacterales bacterium]